MKSMALDEEEQRLIARHRAEKEASRAKWQPRPRATLTGPDDAGRYLALYDMTLRHFNGGTETDPCGPECDCEHYIFGAAMELCLAMPHETAQMWSEFNARHVP